MSKNLAIPNERIILMPPGVSMAIIPLLEPLEPFTRENWVRGKCPRMRQIRVELKFRARLNHELYNYGVFFNDGDYMFVLSKQKEKV